MSLWGPESAATLPVPVDIYGSEETARLSAHRAYWGRPTGGRAVECVSQISGSRVMTATSTSRSCAPRPVVSTSTTTGLGSFASTPFIGRHLRLYGREAVGDKFHGAARCAVPPQSAPSPFNGGTIRSPHHSTLSSGK